MSKSREQLVKYLSEIDITGKVVLDAGCGPKEKWARNFTKGEPKAYITLDDDENCNPDIVWDLHWDNWNDKEIGDHSVLKRIEDKLGWDLYKEPDNNKVDIIFLLETLEHCFDPIKVLTELDDWVIDNGSILYISTPFINPHHDKVDYLRFTDEWFKTVLGKKFQYKDIKIKPRVATVGLANLLAFYKEEGLRMSKIRLKKGQQEKMAEIGYFVEATK